MGIGRVLRAYLAGRIYGRVCCACCAEVDAGTDMASVGAVSDADHLQEAASSSDAMPGQCMSDDQTERSSAPKPILPAGPFDTVERNAARIAILLDQR